MIILLFGYDATWAVLGLCVLAILTGFAISYNINNYETASVARLSQRHGSSRAATRQGRVPTLWKVMICRHFMPEEGLEPPTRGL